MKIVILLLSVLAWLLLADTASAGQTNFNQARLYWSWSEPGGAPAKGFQLGCGSKPKTYDKFYPIGITVRLYYINTIFPKKDATYYCAIRTNDGVSEYSNEVQFRISGNWVHW
jgi:hypothetical protein